jgi:hypothetical protein
VAPNIKLRRLGVNRLERLIFSILTTSPSSTGHVWIGAGGREDLPPKSEKRFSMARTEFQSANPQNWNCIPISLDGLGRTERQMPRQGENK